MSATPDSIAIPELLARIYPDLAADDSPEWLALLRQARIVETPAGASLVRAGDYCTRFLLLLDGTLRIFQLAEDGREVTLYRIHPGDTCLMSLSSLLHDQPFKANAESETASRALMFSAADFHRAMAVSEAFRTRVLTSLVNTVCEMMHTFYDTAFQTLDMRLACLLGRLFERAGSDVVHVTHQDLARELGTSREVVSRLLKKLEQQKFVRLARGRIEIGENRDLPGSTT